MLPPEHELRHWLREYAKREPRHGYRMACGALRLEGRIVNRKKVQRLWREEGLRVPPQQPKRTRVGTSVVRSDRLRATRPNQVWALDFLFDSTADGRPIKALAMCDEFTRESIGRELKRSIKADDVIKILDNAKAVRGAPEFIRMDNGPEMIAAVIRDWCRANGTALFTSSPAALGRILSSSRSTAGLATSCSRARFSTPSSKVASCTSTGAIGTTPSARIARGAIYRRRSSRR